jgi:ribose transport system permease protein
MKKKNPNNKKRLNFHGLFSEFNVFIKLFLTGPLRPIFVGVVIYLVIGFLNPRFFTIRSLTLIAKQSSILSVVGLGLTFVILAGSIDLSVEGVMAISAIACSFLVRNVRNSNDFGLIGIFLALLLASFVGFLNGVIHTKVKIPSIITTLGMWFIARGTAVVLYGGYPITIKDRLLLFLTKESTLAFPNISIVTLVMVILAFFLERFTKLGRYTYVIGGGEEKAKLAGISVDKYKIGIFTIAGFFFGAAGILNTGRIGSGTARVGDGTLLQGIAAVVMGGTALTGGVGGVFRTLIGAITITIVNNGMLILGVSPYIQQAVMGAIIIIAVATNLDRTKISLLK